METPRISSASTTSNLYSGMGELLAANQARGLVSQSFTGDSFINHLNSSSQSTRATQQQFEDDMRRAELLERDRIERQRLQKDVKEALMGKRVVQVFIVDPSDQVPLADSLIYADPAPHLTDLNDQELFFDIDIKGILATHNAKRITLVNKTVKDRVENLEPIRVKDLKMTVVNVASF